MLAEVFVTLILFVVVMVITALLFGGWVIFIILRLIFGGLAALFSATRCPRRFTTIPQATVTCANPRCRGANPIAARFCRRCGVALPMAQHVNVRRAAW